MSGDNSIYSNVSGIYTNKESVTNIRSQQALSTTKTKVVETVELQGNPAVGTVIYFPSTHISKNDSSEHLLLNGKIHLEIIKEMKKRNIKHVFEEGLCFDCKPSYFKNMNQNKVKRWVFGRDPNMSEERRFQLLGASGAANTYGYINSDVYVHKTWTVDERESITREMKKISKEEGHSFTTGNENYRRYHYLISEKREELAVREMMDFLKKNPGTKVALIYGGSHNFKDDFKGLENHPKLISVRFPELYSAYRKIPLKRYYETPFHPDARFIEEVSDETNK